jgi:hypothetical protein
MPTGGPRMIAYRGARFQLAVADEDAVPELEAALRLQPSKCLRVESAETLEANIRPSS